MTTKQPIQIIDGSTHLLMIHVPEHISDEDMKRMADDLKKHGINAIAVREDISITAIKQPTPTIKLDRLFDPSTLKDWPLHRFPFDHLL